MPQRARREKDGYAERIVTRAILAVLLLVASGCRTTAPPADARVLVERARLAMGSELRLTAWTRDEAAAVAAFDAVFQRVRSAGVADERVAPAAATSSG